MARPDESLTELRDGARLIAGRYSILDQIGEGGMARVYRARDLQANRIVALKLLRDAYATDRAAIERFQQEARAAQALEHLHVVRVLDLGSDGPEPYLVMELVSGGDLRSRIQQHGPLALPSALTIAAQVCDALEAAHRRGIVHRDVKPSNILLEARPDARDHAKLGDFGIAQAAGTARQTRTGEVMGSVHYVSPEQLRGQPATPRSDLYGLGCVLFEMLTGAPPFDADTEIAVAMRQILEMPRKPSNLRAGVPAPVDEIVLICLRKQPEQRFASAAELAATLREALRLGQRSTVPIVSIASPSAPASQQPAGNVDGRRAARALAMASFWRLPVGRLGVAGVMAGLIGAGVAFGAGGSSTDGMAALATATIPAIHAAVDTATPTATPPPPSPTPSPSPMPSPSATPVPPTAAPTRTPTAKPTKPPAKPAATPTPRRGAVQRPAPAKPDPTPTRSRDDDRDNDRDSDRWRNRGRGRN